MFWKRSACWDVVLLLDGEVSTDRWDHQPLWLAQNNDVEAGVWPRTPQRWWVREKKMYLGCVASPTLICAHAAPGFSIQDWTLTHYWDMRKERRKTQTENTVSTICLEPNPGVNKEFFLIKHYFLVSSWEPQKQNSVQVTWADLLNLLVMKFQPQEDNCLQPQSAHFIQ